VSNDIIKHFAAKLPVLGVCLGHQCIGLQLRADVVRAEKLMHGKTDQIHHDGKTLYVGMPNPFTATRYHSLNHPQRHAAARVSKYQLDRAEEIIGRAPQNPGPRGRAVFIRKVFSRNRVRDCSRIF
jgi:anthranilate/para-aminobenzoate synthase component II